VVARLSASLQSGPEAHPVTGSSSRPPARGSGVERLPTSSVEVTERVELYLYSPSGVSSPVQM